jgi:hypothetical protein
MSQFEQALREHWWAPVLVVTAAAVIWQLSQGLGPFEAINGAVLTVFWVGVIFLGLRYVGRFFQRKYQELQED